MGYKLSRVILLSEVAEVLELSYTGSDCTIKEICMLSEGRNNSISFCNTVKTSTLEGVVIGPLGLKAAAVINSNSPRYDFCKILNFLIENEYISNKWKGTTISDSSKIAKSVAIEDGVVIGENTIIEHNVTLHSGTIIGDNCIIRANSVISAEGFGFEKAENNVFLRFPHFGRVIIGDNVEIGALNSICKGTLGDTVIKDNVKTDNLVHIAHNCVIGDNTIITASVELSGSVSVGNNVWIGPNVSTMQKIRIGNHSIVGVGSNVTKNVEDYTVVAGNPAKFIKKISNNII
jgi:UDP-3-O-[3-hydroxymyristoyl] glucosamine N-acyltransferase